MNFPLLEVVVAFAAIMLTLSFLVKSLTSVVKNHVDYYSASLEREVHRFLRGSGCTKTECRPLSTVFWPRMGEEFLSTDNMLNWLSMLKKGLTVSDEQRKEIEARLAVHRASLKYAFTKRTNNIALAMGLALCLFLNINAFTIWDTLYRNEEVRAKFTSESYVKSVLDKKDEIDEQIKETENAIKKIDEKNNAVEAEKLKETKMELDKRRAELSKQIEVFQGEVAFGMGRIWKEREKSSDGKPEGLGDLMFFLYEFLGSLLTGILVSIGAPYWHDILRALANLRGLGKPPAEQPKPKP